MDILRPIDLYCERTSSAFWAEPTNALTNLSFFIAGLIFFIFLSKMDKQKRPAYSSFMSISAMSIGIGSFLFHTFANNLTYYLDVIPIFVFQLSFLWFVATHILKLTKNRSFILISLFIISTITLKHHIFHPVLNGSLPYFPSLTLMIVLTYLLFKNCDRVWRYSSLSVLTFSIAIFARVSDMGVCTTFPLGTHFLWHTLNGFTLFLIQLVIYKTSSRNS